MYRANAVRRLIRDYPRAESEDPQSTDEADGGREQNARRQASICSPCVINVLMSCFPSLRGLVLLWLERVVLGGVRMLFGFVSRDRGRVFLRALHVSRIGEYCRRSTA